MTTFQTSHGRYRWLRLPFGLVISSEVFQKRLQSYLDGLKGITCISDDILVYGTGNNVDEANSDHNVNLHNSMQKCRKHGIRLNREKAELQKDGITFLGHVIKSNGLKPDPSKIEGFVGIKVPTYVKEILCFSGMINYLSKYMPRLSDLRKPI